MDISQGNVRRKLGTGVFEAAHGGTKKDSTGRIWVEKGLQGVKLLKKAQYLGGIFNLNCARRQVVKVEDGHMNRR